MSDQVQNSEEEYECGVCAKPGLPRAGCELCGGNQRFAQKRHFTLSEERQGKNKEERDSRYGEFGAVGPKIVNLPGSFNPFSPDANK